MLPPPLIIVHDFVVIPELIKLYESYQNEDSLWRKDTAVENSASKFSNFSCKERWESVSPSLEPGQVCDNFDPRKYT